MPGFVVVTAAGGSDADGSGCGGCYGGFLTIYAFLRSTLLICDYPLLQIKLSQRRKRIKSHHSEIKIWGHNDI